MIGSSRLSGLEFDLSIYDIFGLLSRGRRSGCLVGGGSQSGTQAICLDPLPLAGVATIWKLRPWPCSNMLLIAAEACGRRNYPCGSPWISGDWIEP